ncbi:MAG: c-type cytochrome [Acidobacteriota bacterium]|nr:MAG: c-type cytochrome [Acidobacteriota bacterium]
MRPETDSTLRRLACAGLALLVCGFVSAAWAQREDVIARGRLIYQIHCMGCHGEAGTGNGPMAELLNVQPSDLTQLTRNNKGIFPFDRLYRTIDGRQPVRGHGQRRMPIWGLTFQQPGWDANQEDTVRGRILQVILFLQSIQKVEEPAGPQH